MGLSSSSAAPVGVFDSGVGGLTVLQALMRALPRENFVYLGDTARLPYGTKSAETVARYSVRAAAKLAEYEVKCIVVACNTASAFGLTQIKASAEGRPVIGVIEAGAAAAPLPGPDVSLLSPPKALSELNHMMPQSNGVAVTPALQHLPLRSS
jgi:glutamate racemase